MINIQYDIIVLESSIFLYVIYDEYMTQYYVVWHFVTFTCDTTLIIYFKINNLLHEVYKQTMVATS